MKIKRIKKGTINKIKITKQEPNSDFDTPVFTLRGNEDDIIMADQIIDTVMDPYWNQASSQSFSYDWNVEPYHEIN